MRWRFLSYINPITSAMFITATAPNLLIVKLIADATGADISITWGTWALAALLPGLVCIALVPLVVYAVYPPEIKSTPDASTTDHITAMFAAFYVAGLALGAPSLYLGLLLAGASSLMMSLTHYATGTSPIVFGSGYVSMENWWVMGLIMSIVNLLVWGVAGGLWWKVLGYW